jgi:hypothetical protein
MMEPTPTALAQVQRALKDATDRADALEVENTRLKAEAKVDQTALAGSQDQLRMVSRLHMDASRALGVERARRKRAERLLRYAIRKGL